MITNMEHSVRVRLQNKAHENGRPFQELLQYYGLERYLYRLSQTPHVDKFLLKGALMLHVWELTQSRPTRDIDLLGHLDNEVAPLEAITKEICKAPVVDDGLRFDPTTVVGERIKEHAETPGVRITFTGFLGNSRIPMQIDVGFGDLVYPPAQKHFYPTLLEFPPPTLRMYPRETLVAEKFEAIVTLGSTNSRMKDFFDLWLLSRQFDFDGSELAQAISQTFAHRETEIDASPIALSTEFTTSEAVQMQWSAFVRRSQLDAGPATLEEIREPLREFLLPLAEALARAETFRDVWVAPGRWQAGVAD